MKDIKVLGAGCGNCRATVEMIRHLAEEKGVMIEIEKVEDIQQIMSYGIMSTPGVVVEGELVHAGGVPSKEKVLGWL